MASNNSTKRQRATNFSFSEKKLLLKYALQNRSVLENKESSSVSWKDKNKCWMQIAQLYNSTTTGCVSINCCKYNILIVVGLGQVNNVLYIFL